MRSPTPASVLTRVRGGASSRRLRRHVRKLEGERHARTSPEALARAAQYIAREMERCGLDVALEPFVFEGRTYENVVGRKWGRGERPEAGAGRDLLSSSGEDDASGRTRRGRRGWARSGRPARPLVRLTRDGRLLPRVRVEGADTPPRVLIGAHFDTIPGTPGADDNASGVAGMLEAARLLSGRSLDATVEFVAFNLEELQTYTYRVGSRRYVEGARRKKVRYSGALILEMIGYRSVEEGTQRVPRVISWREIPTRGDFLAVAGDGRSKGLLELFRDAASEAVPELSIVTHRSPLRGWLVWPTRLSDNASFWSRGYPSLMITDTAFLRNPNYHRPSDTRDTLDYDFMAKVTDATVAAAERLAGGGKA